MVNDPEPDDLAPLEEQAAPQPADRLARVVAHVRKVLGTGGLLSEQGETYEERPQQLAMAEAVAEALVGGSSAVIEAGTGTGKTLAYLVPAILSGRKVVVSTATKALQEQLVDKDLPLLQSLGIQVSWAVMKGRGNYLCILRQEQFDAAPVFISRDERDRYVKLRTWAAKTETGDRAELDLPENYVAWRDVSSTAETCLGQDCPRHQSCHVIRMRQRAADADIVVVNHHLFFADLALKRSSAAKTGAEVIPRYDGVVFDEAHNIEEVATEFFGVQSSNWRFYDLCRDVDRAAKARSSWPTEKLAKLASNIGRSVEAYFGEVAALAPPESFTARPEQKTAAPKSSPVIGPPPAPPPTTLSLFDRPAPRETAASDTEVLARALVLDLPSELDVSNDRREQRWSLEPGALSKLTEPLDALVDDVQALEDLFNDIGGDEPEAEVEGFIRRCEELRQSLKVLSQQSTPNLVYWAEVRGRGVFLRASPVDIAEQLRQGLFGDESRGVVLTSATLATGGDTSFFQRRIGLLYGKRGEGDARELVLPSPFDYSRQAALYFPKHLPEPSSEAFLDPATNEIAALIALAKGRTFVLFTSFRAMNEVHRRLAPRIPYQVLLQGERPKGALVRAFREEPSVLFATASFWEGVDVPGDALSMVIIDKLPFASPGDPVVKARLGAIEERGGSSFGEYTLPSAAITLKQGFGRLIRSRRDTGAVAILDTRLWTKSYGSYFRKSLPACPTFSAFPDLKRWWKETRGEG